MRKLIIHPGWYKTATSAIQKALDEESLQLQEQGILYPKSLQFIDCAHHKFALAFKPSGPYRSPNTIEEVLNMCLAEMREKGCDSLLISSELSPLYFSFPQFQKFTSDTFDNIEVVFTLRSQSSCLFSLYSQLVTDPNVRYRESIMHLFCQNIDQLNYYLKISDWAKHVGANNITLIPYEPNIVENFCRFVGVNLSPSSKPKRVHSSLNPLFLSVVKEYCRTINDPAEFRRRKELIINVLKEASSKDDADQIEKQTILSSNEQLALDKYYSPSNKLLLSVSRNTEPILEVSRRKDVCCYDPSAFQNSILANIRP
jgi:hypothetical protein